MDTSLSNRSRVWALLPTACAIHCILTPVFVAALPMLRFGETIEPMLMVFSVFIGAWEASNGHRVHKRWTVGALVMLGGIIWAGSIAGRFEEMFPEAFTSAAGGILVALALFWNGHLRHQVECKDDCACPAPH